LVGAGSERGFIPQIPVGSGASGDDGGRNSRSSVDGNVTASGRVKSRRGIICRFAFYLQSIVGVPVPPLEAELANEKLFQLKFGAALAVAPAST
jgi:hypothetical protein